MTRRGRRVAAVAMGAAALAAAVTANLVLLGEARTGDPMGRLSPALDEALWPRADVVEPAPTTLGDDTPGRESDDHHEREDDDDD